jgi:dethiobiotin synthetase
VVVVTGTGTEVGKTWVSCALLAEARARGWRVAARKPVQSFDPTDASTDADRLAGASGERASDVCPPGRSYPVAMAPPMAAARLGVKPPSLQEIALDLHDSWGPEYIDLGLVEGAGGVASPLASDGDTARLAGVIGADLVLVVADAGLGVINSVRLSLAVLAAQPTIVHLNRFDTDDDLHRLNAEWLVERDGYRVTTTIDGLIDQVVTSPGW